MWTETEGHSSSLRRWTCVEGLSFAKMVSTDDVMNGE